MSDRSEAIKKLADSYTDHVLAYVMGLPAPFSAVVLLAWSAACFAAGAWLL